MMKGKGKTETKKNFLLKLPYSVKKRTFLEFIESFVAYFFMLKLVFPGVFRKSEICLVVCMVHSCFLVTFSENPFNLKVIFQTLFNITQAMLIP